MAMTFSQSVSGYAAYRETPWTQITPGQVAGARLSQLFFTPDGRYWAHSYSRLLTDLYEMTAIP